MNRLSVRLFLAIFVTLVVFSVVSSLITYSVIQALRTDFDESNPKARITAQLKLAHIAAKTNGLEGLRRWAASVDKKEVVPLLVITPEGKDLLDRTVPKHIIRRMGRYPPPPHHKRLAHVTITGETYIIIPHFRGVNAGRFFTRPSILGIPLIIALCISGLVGWLLAKWISLPIGRLRQATKQVASGKFQTRLGNNSTQRKDELGQLANDFNHMASQLAIYKERQTRLMSDMSHELRTPLSRLYVALALAEKKQGESEELTKAELEAQRLEALIEQVLSLSKLNSENTPFQPDDIELNQLLSSIVQDANFEAQKPVVTYHESIDLHLNGDGNWLRYAFENIVRNAVKHSPEEASVTITCGTHSEGLRVEISDNGPGVATDQIDKLFQPFARGDDSRNRSTGGHGLGLAIAKQAIELHGGNITAKNKESGGLRVTIQLPLNR